MSRIFRKVALERLSSPEQLDQLMQVTRPSGWLALGGVGLLLSAALFWAWFGSIPTLAGGEGLLVRRGGVSNLSVTASGRVEEVLVSTGQLVEAGKPVLTLQQEPLLRQIEDTEERRRSLTAELEDLREYAREQRRLTGSNQAQQRANLERSLATNRKEVELLEERMEAESGLLAEGLITKQTLLTTEQSLNDARDQGAALELELAGLPLDLLEAEQSLSQQIDDQRLQIQELNLELRELRARLEEDSVLLAPYTGRVVEMMVGLGDVVSEGSSVMTLEAVSEELVAVLFVSAADGKRVREGMTARITPSTVREEEFGYMVGRVQRVAEFPSTARGMVRLLANEDLVSRLMEAGPPIQIEVTLERDEATPTGYRWSSSRGPDLEISSGTLANGSVVVRRDRPIRLVLPKLRSDLGL